MTHNLFEPYPLTPNLTLKNRIIMAPLTRCMADEQLVPTQAMADYYGRRADCGLIISEAILIRADGQGYPNTPGLFTEAQIQGWRRVTQAVHQGGGKIFAQLWHTGRVAHPFYTQAPVLAPSAVPVNSTLPRMRHLRYQPPQALTLEQIQQLVEDFAQSAANAMAAGFDGVELHGANGYLIDQFLHHDTNRRQDRYGGQVENMTRFALEVVQQVGERIGFEQTALRLSPGPHVNIIEDSRDAAVFEELLQRLNPLPLAYVHLGLADDGQEFASLKGRATDFVRAHYRGTLVGVGGFSPQSGSQAIRAGRFDLLAIGRPLIANPDYVARVKHNQPLVPYHESMLAELL